MVTITEAKPEDLDAIATLLGVLFAQEHEFNVDLSKQRAGLKMILDNPAVGTIFVAREGDPIVGMLNLLFSVSTALGTKVAVVEDFVVSPASRGNGIGTALMDTALSFCESSQFARVMLVTDFDNHGAQRLYESRGFVRSSMVTYKKIL